MIKQINTFTKDFTVVILLICLVACNLNYNTSSSDAVTEDQIKSAMPSIIDEQLETIDPYLDDDLKEAIHSGTRGSSMTGKQIVDKTLTEDKGLEYLTFCYEVNSAQSTGETDSMMKAASNLLDDENYNDLCSRIDQANKRMEETANEYVKGLPITQQKAFYKDLKALVVRTTVLLTAGIVYALVPDTVFWGKVSAAAAISVGAGLTAMTIMSIYERYKFGTEDSSQSFEDWIKEQIKQPKADYALAASVLALGKTFNQGPVVAGIVLCVFALFKVADAYRTMMLTYNFDV